MVDAVNNLAVRPNPSTRVGQRATRMMMPPPQSRGTSGVGKSAVTAQKKDKGKKRSGPVRRLPAKDVKDDVPRVVLREGFVWIWQQSSESPDGERIQSYRCAGRSQGCQATLRTGKGREPKSIQGMHLFQKCKVGYWLSLMPAEERSVTIKGFAVELDPEEALVRWMARRRSEGRRSVETNLDEHSLAAIRRARRESWIKPGATGDHTTDAFAGSDRWMVSARICESDLEYALFVSKRGSELLKGCEIWSVDTAFWACPGGCQQMLNVLGFHQNGFVPFGFAFLPNEEPMTFAWALLELLNFLAGPKDSGVAVRRIVTNFVGALTSGIRMAFSSFYDAEKRKQLREVIKSPIPREAIERPEEGNGLNAHPIEISYCLFGFNQAMVRFCATTYPAGDPERAVAERFLAFFLWLPYFEIDKIKGLVEKLPRRAGICPDFVGYFLETWMPRIEMWKVDMDDGIATNVGIEAFHRDLKYFFISTEPADWAAVQAGLHTICGNSFRAHAKAAGHDSTKDPSARRQAVLGGKDLIFSRLEAWVEGLRLGCQPSPVVSVTNSVEPPRDEHGKCRPEKSASGETEESIRGNNGEGVNMMPNGSSCWYVYKEHCLRKRKKREVELDVDLNKRIESDTNNQLSLASMNAALTQHRRNSQK
jgi:hypothetical protein